MIAYQYYIWTRSQLPLDYYLPLQCHKSSAFYDICDDVLAGDNLINKNDYSGICGKYGVNEKLVDAMYQNSQNDANNLRQSIILSTLFAAFQSNYHEQLTRSDAILHEIKANIGRVYQILFKLSQTLHKRVDPSDKIDLNTFKCLDVLFEGIIKKKKKNKYTTSAQQSNGGHIQNASNIIFKFLHEQTAAKGIEDALACIRDHLLINDPFQLDQHPINRYQKRLSYKTTTLAVNRRRIVQINYLSRLELLRRFEFNGAHLRVCRDTSKASFLFAPLRCESAMLDSINHCHSILLAAVSNVATLRDSHNISIQVSCRTLILIGCSNIKVFLLSKSRPIIQDCSNVIVAPFNTIYEGFVDILSGTDQSLSDNLQLKEPINIGNSSWKFMETSKFLCQLTPLHTDQSDIDALFDSLPLCYRQAAIDNWYHVNRHDNHDDNSPIHLYDVISKRDLVYLKSKIDHK